MHGGLWTHQDFSREGSSQGLGHKAPRQAGRQSPFRRPLPTEPLALQVGRTGSSPSTVLTLWQRSCLGVTGHSSCQGFRSF